MAATGRSNRTRLAQEYAAMALESEERGDYGRAANLYRAALSVLYNIPEFVPNLCDERGVPENDTETGMPGDPSPRFQINEGTGTENSARPEMAPGNT